MQRRSLLASVAALSVLAGCATDGATTPTTTPPAPVTVSSVVAAYVQLMSQAGVPLLTQIESITDLPAEVVKQINTDVGQITAAAPNVVEGVAEAIAQPSVATISSAVNGIVAALHGFTLSATAQTILADFQNMLPFIEAGVGIIALVGANVGGVAAEQKAAQAADSLRVIVAAH